ncbi:MAG: vanadium-dependent haloperoxidase [Thaumarchaeota archaeon]|nr:vanadium-dependent haloperoxidase [Nitrososphaerota archaeon]
MGTTGTIVHAFVLVAAVAAGSILAIDFYVSDELGTESATAQEAMAQLGSPFARGGYTSFDVHTDAVASFPPFPPYPDGLPWPPGYQDSYNNPSFTMENGNAVFGVVIPHLGTWIYNSISPNFAEPSLTFRYVTLILNVGYDATAPYSENAKGVYSHIDNRDSSEYTDSTNMNIASIQAMYRLAMAFDSSEKTRWDKMLTDSELSVSDYNYFGNLGANQLDCSDPTQDRHLSGLSSDRAAVAIGNIAAQCVIEGRANDGFNQVFNGNTANQFRDNTGYTSVNTVDNLVDLSRWQPLEITASDGVTFVQQYITPQWANTEPYTAGLDPRDYRTPNPVNSDYYANQVGYKAQADEVLVAVAALTQEQKMLAEYFDNKARETLFFPAVEALPKASLLAEGSHVATGACPPRIVDGQAVPYEECLNTRDFWQLDFMLHIAQFDAGIVTWQEKTRHDAVRPITAIQYLYDGETVNHYNGDVQGENWQPYLVTSDHPEYPSATTCFCAAQAAAWKLYHGGSDTIPDVNGDGVLGNDLAGVLRPQSSVHEPNNPLGPVPVAFATWSDYTAECAESRIYGGVHFRDAVDASLAVCDDVGVAAYHYFDTLLAGTADLKRPAVALSPDPLRDPSNFPARSLVCR